MYDPYIIIDELGRYFRFTAFPVQVCPMTSDPDTYAIVEGAANQIGAIVPTVVHPFEEGGCDVTVFFVEDMPGKCGAYWWGCTSYQGFSTTRNFISAVSYVRITAPEWEWIVLHELMHAYGIVYHREVKDSVMCDCAYYPHTLTEWDQGILRYLYGQPGTYPDQQN